MSTRIEFDRLPNTRDLGGMKTTDGHTIVSGKLIRSGQLVDVSEKDLLKLEALVGTVVDMRTEGERTSRPDVVIPGCEYLHIPIVGKLAPGITHEVKSSEELLEALVFKPDMALNYMCDLYREFVKGDFSLSQYGNFLNVLLKEHDKAVLWHCTAGKDRVGTSSIILERLLGVSDQDILEDYLQTNTNLNEELLAVIRYAKAKTGNDSDLIDRSLGYLYGADEEYLKAFYVSIDERFGSFEGFVRDGIGFSDADVEALRSKYLC